MFGTSGQKLRTNSLMSQRKVSNLVQFSLFLLLFQIYFAEDCRILDLAFCKISFLLRPSLH